MKGVRAAARYARAFQQLAQEKSLLDTVIVDVKLIHNTINGSKDLALMLKSPLIKADQKSKALTSIFEKKIHELTLQFVNLIVSHKRETILTAICEEFINTYNSINNIARVTVTTSTALTDALRTELVTKIKADYSLSSVELTEKVDESLIGGMILRIGDKQLDASIRRQLNDIKQELVQA
ncbi:MAG: ATP synthase F1 subunit delta [Flavobacteriales bacterium]|nr:ATP synthase F1 subunit delta [Flavobacteriales bacterium]